MDKIKYIHIEDFLNKYTLTMSLYPDVNIIVGKNGSGKSRLLNNIDVYFNHNLKRNITIDANKNFRCLFIESSNIRINTNELPYDRTPKRFKEDQVYIFEEIIYKNLWENNIYDWCIPLEYFHKLSSGKRHLLNILYSVYYFTEKYKESPKLILIDDPEIHLHIDWQDKLIDMIKQISQDCQLIIATHSPSIFSGYGDKLIFIEDLLEKN